MQGDSLSDVSACPRGLSTVGHGDAKDVPKRGKAGLQVQLGGLRQVGL